MKFPFLKIAKLEFLRFWKCQKMLTIETSSFEIAQNGIFPHFENVKNWILFTIFLLHYFFPFKPTTHSVLLQFILVAFQSRLRLKKLFALEFLQRCPLAPRSQNIFNILLYRACGKWYVQFLIWCGWLGTGQIGRFLTGRITFHRPGRAKC